MNGSIVKKLPSDVLDEIVIADQTQVLEYFEDDDYTDNDVASLVEQCRSFDLIRAHNIYANSVAHAAILPNVYDEIKEYPNEYKELESLTEDEKKKYTEEGLRVMAKGQFALVLLAGGQATRLNINRVKGNCDFGFPSHKTLFQRLMESIRYVQRLVKEHTGTEIALPIYIMTSQFNRKEIEVIFSTHNYYGLNQSQIVFFSQGSLPCVDDSGHIIMREKHKIALSPDGSGGVFPALDKNHFVFQWKQQGIEFVQIFGIDN
ncbi:hypothetical protein WA577_004041, partial [Blastocystis sp. JDR]